MSKEKQIEEMARIIYDNHGFIVSSVETAEKLYNAGYRKQSEGEWLYNPNGTDWGIGAWECSICRCKNNNLPIDGDTIPMRWAGTRYCPNCGAKMKGGE